MTKKYDLWKAAARSSKLRPALCGMYHDSSVRKAVCTDGHILAASSEYYNEEYADTIRNKEGKKIKSIYPKWQWVVPNRTFLEENCTHIKIPMDKLKTTVRVAKQLAIKRTAVEIEIEHLGFSADELLPLLLRSDGECFLDYRRKTGVYWASDEFIFMLLPILHACDIDFKRIEVCPNVYVRFECKE